MSPDCIQHHYVFIPVSSKSAYSLFITSTVSAIYCKLSGAAGGRLEKRLCRENSERLIHYWELTPAPETVVAKCQQQIQTDYLSNVSAKCMKES